MTKGTEKLIRLGKKLMLIGKTVIAICVLSVGATASASYRTYEANLDESDWQFKGSLIGCELSHKIPFYGQARFYKKAGKAESLAFELNYKRQIVSAVRVASVQSLSPSWLPLRRPRSLGEMTVHQGGKIFQAKDTSSWKLLNELEVGRFPTFRYQDFDSPQDQVSVALSAVGFKRPYEKFLNCLDVLVPYKLSELKRMTMQFDFNKYSVKEVYLGRLKALAAYIKDSPEVDVVFVSGHTDSKGSRGYNQKLSENRISAVIQKLSLEGTDPSRFKTAAFGEKDPIATNRNKAGRAQNRRVYIKID